MKIINKITHNNFPFDWVNLDLYSESKAGKKEIYLIKNEDLVEELIILFYTLFNGGKGIYVYNDAWGDFCLDTWNASKDTYDYDLEGKSDETREYITMLKVAGVEIEYSGSCECLNWDKFLHIVLKCIVSQLAPFSPIFYDEKNDFFFYFHHSGSIGIYYTKKNKEINRIFEIAKDEFDLR
ncbi:MAG TPA: hypothetical protein VF476_15580 [Chitinophagaceae bacterium]